MPRFFRPVTSAVTYTRWLHLLIGAAIALILAFIYPGLSDPSVADWLLIAVQPIPLVAATAVLPSMRRAEGLQARLMLFPGQHARVPGDDGDSGVSVAPSASWSDRGRTAVWLVLRLEAGCAAMLVTIQLLGTSLALVGAASSDPAEEPGLLLPLPGPDPANALLVPVPIVVLLAVMVAAGRLMTSAARQLLGPSPKERLAALEERTEQLLERNRIARELHDSIGHALTVAVVQAGAARAAADPAFTDRALGAIEETGRAALEDLERVLRVLREDGQRASRRPTLAEADQLLASARASGAKVDTDVSGPVERVPGPVSREAYRMLQEALTNVLRHCGPVPVRVRVAVGERALEIDVSNALPAGTEITGRGGSGLRGIRERATLLGGRAATGPRDGEWQVHVELPLG
ncbi:two-component sensor histidine kinase [Streptomyces longisporoflavus]|uniref:sensor histidine kinase n=1 Tax=Streptomyces longisporoflavus TaxID=28044 RepID=UPI00167CE3E2|nr:histidine kinase [Streptomyces longisporoflavus]GGV56135.1 two-component sensor histidine kinase [Streptomyces longisporoflavus]